MSASVTFAPVRPGLVTAPPDHPEQLRLIGSRCSTCKEVSIGTNAVCLNCGGDDIEAIPLGREGVLWTFTVVRHKPPGDYRGPDPFVPFGLGLVELPEGIRVMAPIEGDIAKLAIGLKVHIKPRILDDGPNGALLAFAFAPSA